MKLKNSLNMFIAFHISSDLDRVSSMKIIDDEMKRIYSDKVEQIFVDDEHVLIENKLKDVHLSGKVKKTHITTEQRAKIKWLEIQEKNHSVSGTEVIYAMNKPLMVSKDTDIFFENLHQIFTSLNQYYPHFTQIDEKTNKGKGKE